MKNNHLILLAIMTALAVVTISGGATAQAAHSNVLGTLQVDRGLPTSNLNNDAGASRSNVAWSNDNNYVSGDSFTVGSSGQVWVVTQIRTWSVAGHPVGGPNFLGDIYSDVTLYTGGASGALAPVFSGTLTLGSNTNSNSNIVHTRVTYANNVNYQGSSGDYLYVWQNDFAVNWIIDGGVTQYFAVDGTPRGSGYWFNHASNAALSGSTQQGADNRWIAWSKSALGTPNTCDSNGPISGICDGGWDKSSDINVQVTAYLVVVPADKDACKLDGWRSLYTATGEPFKNLGDCIQYVNTGK